MHPWRLPPCPPVGTPRRNLLAGLVADLEAFATFPCLVHSLEFDLLKRATPVETLILVQLGGLLTHSRLASITTNRADRYALGVMPTCLRKASLKFPVPWYPTLTEISRKDSHVYSRNSRQASVIRISRRYLIGGVPTSRMNLRTKSVLDI